MDSLITAVGVVWEYAKFFASSNFFVAFISASAGAFGGALGAQMISKKTRRKEDLQKELRNTNAAIMLAFGICNSYLMVKEKLVNPIKENFDRQKLALEEFEKRPGKALSGESAGFTFQADFRTITPLSIRTDLLQTLAFERISLSRRPLALVDALTHTIHSLDSIIVKRNQLIEAYRAQPSTRDLVFPYFGRPDDLGNIDTSYPDSMQAIIDLTDDCIFFTNLLCSDLVAHGKNLSERYENTISKKDVPTINPVDFDIAERNDLMPDPAGYPDWTSSFVKHPDKS